MNNQIAKLEVKAELKYLSEVISFVGKLAVRLGLEKNDAKKLELITEETCANVIEHAFDPGEEGKYQVIIERQPGKVVIAVEDQGLPFNFTKFKPDENKGLGMLLMRAFADEIKFLNIGRGGKRVEFSKNLQYEEIEHSKPEEKEVEKAPLDEEVNIRIMKPEDADKMARCIYRSYGYTYGWEFIYYPEKVKELLKSGYLTSCIYTNSEEEIIGHFAMIRPSPKDLVGETGMAVTDPRYRGRGLFKKMKLFMAEHARKTGVHGFYSEAVAVHPYSQKGNLSLGARETGVLLGLSPPTMKFKNIEKKDKTKRTPAMFFYYKILDGPVHDSYLPFHHKAIIKKIYEIGKLKRNEIEKFEGELKLAEKTQIDVTVKPERGFAFMNIIKFGEDFLELVKFRLRELCFRHMNCIYIDLPLSNPASQQFCASLEMLGFFFAGIIPEKQNGDVLRLQFLNNVEVDPNEIITASEFGEELAAYVGNAYKSMMER
ncbi:MAG: ATP-binding protein [Candidatus Cloacimonetes bacterium]|nr:ATP-binding protein [Candidatus Cloacimonadota bacterium]MCF7814062.1 ATP-binding protein [Candidatus Cloacimonadota bacterium]MCF7868636.1 ATP-binding protein [Candidatus Cloacimonadota bacterium]MCF7884091.1 ATP-binding protein [Candidatus Cloacimonadota bacterium]